LQLGFWSEQFFFSGGKVNMKSRLWCFTNFDLEFDYDKYLADTTALYLAVGREVCPKSKREHDQGWVYFEGQRGSIKQVAKQLGGCHVEMCKGNIDQQEDYCSKDGKYREFGVKPRPGARTDLDGVRDDIMKGTRSVDEICVESPALYHQYGRTLHKLEDIALRAKHRTWMTAGIWYWGASGAGKSHRAFQDFDPRRCYVFPNDGGWWDGYSGQETVIINEFRGGIPYSELLDLCDKWPKSVRRRGREPVPFLAQRLIVTSVLRPDEVYSGLAENDSLEQLYRRFELVEVKRVLDQRCSEGNTEPLSQDDDWEL
jgi:hypothetical protein